MLTTQRATAPNGSTPLLRQTELRNLLTEKQLQELERLCRPLVRNPGTTLFRQGDPADTFYLLVDGMVELRARPPGRRAYRTVELIGPSCTFGDEALLGEQDYLAGARVIKTARCLALSRAAFEMLAANHPDVALGVARCATACLVKTVRRAAILTQAPADVGLRLLLEELSEPDTAEAETDDSGNEESGAQAVPVRITHAQLAGVLHVSRETVSRMLSQLASSGELEVGRGVIRLLPS
jgi:CRP-like cAMP-binding protein